MNEILIPLLESVKNKDGSRTYCCVHQWLIAHRKVKTGKLADAWGLARRTVQYWRRKLKLGVTGCEKNSYCCMNRGNFGQGHKD